MENTTLHHAVARAESLFAEFESEVADAANNAITNLADCLVDAAVDPAAQSRVVELLAVAAKIRQLAEETVSEEGQALHQADVEVRYKERFGDDDEAGPAGEEVAAVQAMA